MTPEIYFGGLPCQPHSAPIKRPYTHDYRAGRSMWGHALHADLWRDEPPRIKRSGFLWLRKTVYPRAVVPVHSQVPPQVGDFVLFSGKSGLERRWRVVEVRPYWNPDDMYGVVLEATNLQVAP